MDVEQHLNDLHRVWFADSLSEPEKASSRFALWFAQSDDFDKELEPFAGLPDLILNGECEVSLSDPRSLLCSLLAVDQLPRNFYRGSPKAFEYDAHALALCREGVTSGVDLQMHQLERLFFYLPLQHVEDKEMQAFSLTTYEGLYLDCPSEWKPLVEGVLKYARQHQEIIDQFGRFPHRNAILGRESTAAEAAWLDEGGERFGQ